MGVVPGVAEAARPEDLDAQETLCVLEGGTEKQAPEKGEFSAVCSFDHRSVLCSRRLQR